MENENTRLGKWKCTLSITVSIFFHGTLEFLYFIIFSVTYLVVLRFEKLYSQKMISVILITILIDLLPDVPKLLMLEKQQGNYVIQGNPEPLMGVANKLQHVSLYRKQQIPLLRGIHAYLRPVSKYMILILNNYFFQRNKLNIAIHHILIFHRESFYKVMVKKSSTYQYCECVC